MKWAEKFGWGIGSRLIAAILKSVKKKQRHEEIFEEAAEIHAKQFADRIDADVLIRLINPRDNNRDVWKQNRIDFLMTKVQEYNRGKITEDPRSHHHF